MLTALVNGRLLTADGVVSGKSVLVDGPQLRDVVGATPKGTPRYDLQGDLLLPGFIDVQVNGGGGVLFNDQPSVEGLRAIGKAHARFGTAGFLPTLVSGDLATIAKAIAAVDEAIAAKVPGVLGIHVEGPFLSLKRHGIHDARNFRTIDADAVRILSSLKRGKTVVTLAPEVCGLELIAALAKAGVIVCAGHTDATYDEMRAALDHSVRGFTHLFNAMSPLAARAPGAVGAALDDADSWCGIIADGHHVHPASLRIAFACKGPDKLMLVTDAMPPVGSPQKTFDMQGKTIRAVDGACYGPDGTLAGTDVGMADVARNAQRFLKLNLPALARLSSGNAASFLGIEPGRIAAGGRADLVLVDETFAVRQTWIGGMPQLP
jgi:N-acetylglucosamine-6-phosphate deacetylase